MPYCPECGKQISQAAKFCRECGCNLNVEDIEQVQQQTDDSPGGDVQHSSEAIDGPVKDNLDWLQNFRTQHEEVIQLSLELQNIAKGIPLIPQESENKISGGVGEQLKELQYKFANLEKALTNGPKPKRSDLRKMNSYLQSACVYFGVACVAYRKWAEQPSSSIEAYTTERLEKAGKFMDKVNEQLELLSNKSVSVKGDASRDDLEANHESKPRKRRFTWFRSRPNTVIFLAGMLPIGVGWIIYIINRAYKIVPDWPSWLLIVFLILAVIAPLAFPIISGWALKQKGRSIRWLLLVVIPFTSMFIMAACDHMYYWDCPNFSFFHSYTCYVRYYSEFDLAAGLTTVAWFVLIFLPHSTSFLSHILTKEQMDSGLYLEKNHDMLNLYKEGEDDEDDELLFTFYRDLATDDYIREEAQKFVKPLSQEEGQ